MVVTAVPQAVVVLRLVVTDVLNVVVVDFDVLLDVDPAVFLFTVVVLVVE